MEPQSYKSYTMKLLKINVNIQHAGISSITKGIKECYPGSLWQKKIQSWPGLYRVRLRSVPDVQNERKTINQALSRIPWKVMSAIGLGVLSSDTFSMRQGANYGGARLPLIRHGLPWKRDLWKFGGSQKILTVLFWRAVSVLCNVIIVDYYV